MKLFNVRKDGKNNFFSNKAEAKASRGEAGHGVVVSRGPDHMGVHGTPGRKPWRGVSA